MLSTFRALTLITTLFPLLLKTLSECSAFPPALCGARVVFLLLRQFKLEAEGEVIFTLLIKLIDWRR
jgi:hypothetical protein